MRKIGIIAFLTIIIFVFHFNLPPDDIKDHISMKQDAGFFEELASSVMTSQTVAKWQYYNFIIVRFAYSDRLDMRLVGLPFCKWMVLNKGEKKNEKK